AAPHGYHRALLKISGEAFAGDKDFGLNGEKISWIAREIISAAEDGRRIGVVVGGGNIMRGVDANSIGVDPLVGDEMGMVATVINALALKSTLESQGCKCKVMSSFEIAQFVDAFSMGSLMTALEQNEVIIFAGGTGNPCFTTDSAAALRAVQMRADVMIKATQVDGVYDKDPKQFSDARRFESISAEETLRRRLGVLDVTSVEILARYSIPTVVLNLHVQGNIARALIGEKIGTMIVV
ncbi:MAG: UMP kinase, partial [Desulfomonilaceae bacterium]